MATNTVPIEIVLQDPNNPIVPPSPDPSGPDDPGENTNILVPDTALGTGTTKNSNGTNGIFSGTNATASIASIIVLVLALGAIITLLVRRYQKHKKSTESKADNVEQSAKVSRKEKLLAATSGTLAVLAATVLVGNLLITATNAATNDTNDTTTLATPDKIQIIANRYDDVTILASAKAVSYASTDTTFGYKIFMSMAGKDANLYLDGDNASEHYFAPTTRAGLSNNSWGYSLDDGAEQAMPLASDPIVAQQITEAVEDEEFTVYYTMKADKDMPFGVYSGEIAYDIQGYNGFPASLTTMQGMTAEICDAVYTPGNTVTEPVPTATLTDIRDGKTYEVAKLADGKCWMTQNLDLQKEGLTVALNSDNTDHPANGFTLPTSQAYGDESWGSSYNRTDVETTHVYDVIQNAESPYRYCLKYIGSCAEWGDVISSEELGNLYNWYTATAGTGTYDVGSGDDKQAAGSICPKGWRLPNSNNSYEATDFTTLLYRYGIIESPTSPTYISSDKTAIFKAPLSLVPEGRYENGFKHNGTGGLWASPAASSSAARYFGFYVGDASPWYQVDKTRGYTVRCVAR